MTAALDAIRARYEANAEMPSLDGFWALAQDAIAALDRAEVALRIIADGTSYDPEGAIPVRPRNIARAALADVAGEVTG